MYSQLQVKERFVSNMIVNVQYMSNFRNVYGKEGHKIKQASTHTHSIAIFKFYFASL